MKNKLYYIVLLLAILAIICFVYSPIVNAADEYSFELNYTGDIVINEPKDGRVILRGTNGTTYPRVRIKVDIQGPATPRIMATDSSGVEHDIAQLGYWGPDTGFAVQGTFENVTPIKATFLEEGTYTITLSLINLDANNAIITTKTEVIEVLEDISNVGNVENNTENVENENIEKLPQTGTSIMEYIIYAGIITTIIGFGYYKTRKVRQ